LEIALFQRLTQRDLVNLGRFRRNQCFSHGLGLNAQGYQGKARIRAFQIAKWLWKAETRLTMRCRFAP
jgi:hypothetical protein